MAFPVRKLTKNFFLFTGSLIKSQRQNFSKTYYGREIDFENYENFETEVRKLRSKMARRSLAFSQSAAVSVYSLVLLDEIEVDNIITVIEGIRYGRSADNILSMIIPT